jgi:uncharacterized protein (TIGR02145 family)
MKKEEITIGDQVWMAENLSVDKFRNGDPIPEVKTDEEWVKAGENEQPAWCWSTDDPEKRKEYGKLYNWFSLNDPRGLAPQGYRIPTDDELEELIVEGEDYGDGDIEYILKPEIDLPLAGTRQGSRYGFGTYGGCWSSTVSMVFSRYLYFDSSLAYVNTSLRSEAHSVRCLKD